MLFWEESFVFGCQFQGFICKDEEAIPILIIYENNNLIFPKT